MQLRSAVDEVAGEWVSSPDERRVESVSMLFSPRTARGCKSLAAFTSGSAPEALGGHAFAVG
eukprot:4651951-Prymnesium_polylepis.1